MIYATKEEISMYHISNFYSLAIQHLDMYHIVSEFFIYSILGWMVKSIYMSICNRKLTNRGFIKGPICPIYGGAATVIYFLLLPLSGNYVKIYFVGVIVSTAIEYAVAQIMLVIFGEVWWDYNNKPFNYKGVICLESSIAWGFYCVMLFAFLEKSAIAFVDFYTAKIGLAAGEAIITLLIVYYMVSFLHTVNNHRRLNESNMECMETDENDIKEEAGEVDRNDKSGGYIARTIRMILK